MFCDVAFMKCKQNAMRLGILVIIILAMNTFSFSQENRSATELAKENISAYLQEKIFSGKIYSPISFQPLTSYKVPRKTNIAWTIGHEFRILAESFDNSTKESRFGFLFYLDKKMAVLRAESYEIK